MLQIEFESEELRERYFPGGSETSPEWEHWMAEHGAAWERFFAMIEITWRDYVELGK